MNAAHKNIWYGVLAANSAIILFYWWQASGSFFGQGVAGAAVALGRLAGLAAAFSVLLQFVFMGRMPLLERVFGLDRLASIHKLNGKLSFYFLVSHPLLLAFGYGRFAGIGMQEQLLMFLTDYERVLWAGFGFVLFMLVIASSIVIVRSRLKYEAWYFVHLLVYAAVFFSFWHQFSVGGTLLASKVFYGYWMSLYVVIFVAYACFRFLRPLHLFYRHRFAIDRIERESPTAVSVYISGKHMDRFRVKPGQFMIFRFLTKGMWWQAHPFSLSKPCDGKQLRITVRELGDFTKQVGSMPVGTRVVIDGPYGVFTKEAARSEKPLFIAGGIGITPLRSLMEQFVEQKKDSVLLYGNKGQADIPLGKELDDISRSPFARVIHVLSSDNPPGTERGYIDEEKIGRLVPDVTSRDVYVCGPPPMMEAVMQALRKLGVSKKNIHYEKFSL